MIVPLYKLNNAQFTTVQKLHLYNLQLLTTKSAVLLCWKNENTQPPLATDSFDKEFLLLDRIVNRIFSKQNKCCRCLSVLAEW